MTAFAVTVDIVDHEDGGIALYVTNHGVVEEMDRVLVRVDTDADVAGWGEMREFRSFTTARLI